MISPFASADPDGLERVAINIGFINNSQSAPFELIPDYAIPFLGETPISTIAAGAVGVLVVLAVAFLVGRSLQQKRAN